MTQERALELAYDAILKMNPAMMLPSQIGATFADVILAAIAEDRANERKKSAEFLMDAAGLDVSDCVRSHEAATIAEIGVARQGT